MFGGELLSQKTLENSFRNPANRKRPFVRRTVNWNALVGGVRYDIARLGMGSFWYVVTILVPILWIAHVLAFALLFTSNYVFTKQVIITNIVRVKVSDSASDT